ncbi:MAG TPA: hypothetical protein ENI61_06195, partial [Ignavibacteria bacterium]|nr:hypothetical protein [Ignavibacteria bacterium]
MLKNKTNLILSILLICSFQLFGQGPVESTTKGGLWTSFSTWKDKVVPAPGDNVLIKGPVKLILLTYANSIQIFSGGSLVPEKIESSTYKLYVANNLSNNGTISGYYKGGNNGRNLEIFIGGN